MTHTVPQALADRITQLYAAFNRRDVEAVLAGLADDVVWANGMDGGYVHGHAQLREYWSRQFAQISSTVEPETLEQWPDGCITVHVHQEVRSVDGTQVLADGHVRHQFAFRDGLVSRFDIIS